MQRRYYQSHKPKIRIKRVLIVVCCFCLFVLLVFSQLTRIKLMIKGYDFHSQNIILSLDDQQIDEYLLYNNKIDFHKWDKVKNQQHYYDYQYYSQLHKNKSILSII